MIEFVTTSFRLLRTMASAWMRDPEFRSLLVLTVITLLQRRHAHDRGPGRPLAQDRNWQDLHDNIQTGKIFTIIYIFGPSIILGLT